MPATIDPDVLLLALLHRLESGDPDSLEADLHRILDHAAEHGTGEDVGEGVDTAAFSQVNAVQGGRRQGEDLSESDHIPEEKEDDSGLLADDPRAYAEMIADILYGLYGEDALADFMADSSDDDDLEEAEIPVGEAWNALHHPRGKNGRFIPKGSGEARAAASEVISKVLRGEHDGKADAESVAQHLSILTVKQIKDLHREHGHKPPRELREGLVNAVLSRLPVSEKEKEKPQEVEVEDVGGSHPDVAGGGADTKGETPDVKGEAPDTVGAAPGVVADAQELTGDDVAAILAGQHHNVKKAEQGLDRSPDRMKQQYVSSERFVLMDIPVDAAVPPVPVLPGQVSHSSGPIIVDANRAGSGMGRTERHFGAPAGVVILDGKHRHAEALARGEKTIRAMVGDKAVPEIQRLIKQAEEKASATSNAVREYLADPNGSTSRGLRAVVGTAEFDRIKAARQLLAAGKSVPPEVLADYPDLAAKYGQAPTPDVSAEASGGDDAGQAGAGEQASTPDVPREPSGEKPSGYVPDVFIPKTGVSGKATNAHSLAYQGRFADKLSELLRKNHPEIYDSNGVRTGPDLSDLFDQKRLQLRYDMGMTPEDAALEMYNDFAKPRLQSKRILPVKDQLRKAREAGKAAADARKATSGEKPNDASSPSSPADPKFTGTDSLGRKWVNGELVAAHEEPAEAGGEAPTPDVTAEPTIETPRSLSHAASMLDGFRQERASTDDPETLAGKVDAVGKWLAGQKKRTALGDKLLGEASALHDQLMGGTGHKGTRVNVSSPDASPVVIAKPFSVGDVLTYTGRIGSMPAEFRGFHTNPETGEKAARVIVRPDTGPPFEASVKPSELSAPTASTPDVPPPDSRVSAALDRYRNRPQSSGGGLFGGNDLQDRVGFSKLPNGTKVVVTEGTHEGKTGRISREMGPSGERVVLHVDGVDGAVPITPSAVEPLDSWRSWRGDNAASASTGEPAAGLFSGVAPADLPVSPQVQEHRDTMSKLNEIARSGKPGDVDGYQVESTSVGQFKAKIGNKTVEGDLAYVASRIQEANRKKASGGEKITVARNQGSKPGKINFPVREPDGKPPETPERGKVYNVNTEHLAVDPSRFQYKLNTANPAGVTDEFKDVRVFNPDFAGVISVWKDPADGKTYVVNGHHRTELAKRLGHPDLAVRYIQAGDAREARAIGALVNMAEGRGTAIDAAKFLRDTGRIADDLEQHGVSIRGAVAREATVLTALNDRLFNRLALGLMDKNQAVAIGANLPDHNLQDQLSRKLEQYADRTGHELSPKVVGEMAREFAMTPTRAAAGGAGGGGLFGDLDSEESLITERGELKAHVRGELARIARDFSAVSSARRAKRVAGAGNVLNVDDNRQIARDAERTANVYDALVNYRGEVSDIINEEAVNYARATSQRQRQEVKERTAERVGEVLKRELANDG